MKEKNSPHLLLRGIVRAAFLSSPFHRGLPSSWNLGVLVYRTRWTVAPNSQDRRVLYRVRVTTGRGEARKRRRDGRDVSH